MGPSRAAESNILAFDFYFDGNWSVINSVRVGPLLFLGGLCNFQKISCTAKTAKKNLQETVVEKKNKSSKCFLFPGLMFQYVKKNACTSYRPPKKFKNSNLKARKKKIIGYKGNSEFCLSETPNVRLGEHGIRREANLTVSSGASPQVLCYTSQLKNSTNCN